MADHGDPDDPDDPDVEDPEPADDGALRGSRAGVFIRDDLLGLPASSDSFSSGRWAAGIANDRVILAGLTGSVLVSRR